GPVVLGGASPRAERLARLHAEMLALIDTWAPSVVVLERAFVARNVQSAFRMGEARGVVLGGVAGGGGAAPRPRAPAVGRCRRRPGSRAVSSPGRSGAQRGGSRRELAMI